MKLPFTTRTVFGKKVARLRREGLIPVVCYGAGQESGAYTVPVKQLQGLMASDDVVIEVEGDLQGKQVMLQDVAVHPVSGTVLHADFLFVDLSQEVEYEVQVRTEGESPGVKVKEGQMVVALDRIVLRALPQHIPSHLVADVSGLDDIGTHLTVADLAVPDNVTLVSNPEDIVISIVKQTQEEEEPITEGDDYLDQIEVTGKGGKKEEEEEETGEGDEDQS